MRTWRWWVAGAVVGIALTTSGVLIGLSSGADAKTSSALVKSEHVSFENCNAKTTVLTARLVRLTYNAVQPVLVGLTIKNESNQACGPEQQQGVTLDGQEIQIDGCGNLRMEFDDSAQQNVFPGPKSNPSTCPTHFAVPLRAHATLSATGIWDQQDGQLNQMEAPAGKYRIVVEGRRLFTITLTRPDGSGPGGLPHFVPPPAGACGRTFSLIGTAPPVSTTTTTTTPLPKCPIGNVQTPSGGSITTPTTPPSTTTVPPSTTNTAPASGSTGT